MIGDAKMDVLHYPLMSKNLDRFIIDYKLYPQSFNISDAKSMDHKELEDVFSLMDRLVLIQPL